jgi:thiol:disulfide interchange protein DsbD
MLKRCLAWTIAAVFYCAVVFLFPVAARANPVQTPHVEVQLVSEVQSIQPGTPFWVGLNFKIKPGWHTYWRNPGDSGSPPSLKWTLPDGFTASEFSYPYPERLPAGPLMNFGYEDRVMLLTEVTPPPQVSPAKPMQLRAKADWLVCQVDCIPETANLSLTLPVAPQAPSFDQSWRSTFEQTRQAIPKPSPWTATAAVEGETLLLRVKTPPLQPDKVQKATFFPDEDGIITNAAVQAASFGPEGLVLKLQRGNRSEFDRVTGVLVLQEQLDHQSAAPAFTIQAPVDRALVAAAPAPTASLPLWQVSLLALLGGLALNLMPCVFPVLSLKAFNIVQRSAESPKRVRLGAIAFTAGVLVSFAVVAGTLLVLRGLGQQIGWGFQLQSPAFVLLMAYMMFGVGLSLSGVFVFGASLMGMGQKLTTHSGYLGEFFTGVFATVVATPCTAPFMATAIGIALTQPAPVAIAIFELLGLGLALPYLILSWVPAVQRRLPKPGAWMETFAQLLAFPMYGATAWLVWVITQQTGPAGLAIASTGLILLAFAAWLHQKTRRAADWGQRVGTIAALSVLGLALTLTQLPTPTAVTQTPVPSQTAGLAWQPYSPEALATLRQSGKPVFVNFTAAWCITCQVNEQVAFNQSETIAAFQAKNVSLLKADWTNRNPTITKALESFGRSGVPLYVLYPASSGDSPIVLPQLLSPGDVQTALKNLQGS